MSQEEREMGPLRRSRRTLATTLVLIAICLLAFGLRVYDLDGQSMWSDEGLSYYRAQQPLGVVLENTITVDGVRTIDTNPPFYFLLLHAWRALLGESIVVLRMMGVLAALLAIPLMYLVGRALFWREAGIVAALFLALSPFHVWQTQVLRNYGLLITLNLFCIYGLVRYTFADAKNPAARKWTALWLGAGLLGVYTHYFGFFVVAFTLVVYVVAALARARAPGGAGARRLGLGLLLAMMLALPAVLAAWSRFRTGRQFDFYDVDALGVAVQAISVFSVGMSPVLTHPWWLYAAGLLLTGGVIPGWRLRRRSTLLLIGYQIAPLGMLLALSKVNPLFNGTRHLLIGLPPFLLLCAVLPTAHGRQLPRRLGLFVAVIFLTIQVIWLQRQFHHTAFVRDDVRAAADYLNRMAEPGDRIILHDTLIKFAFDAYYHGAAPVTAAPLFGQHDEDEALARLQTAAARGERVWFLTHPEPRTGFPRELLWRWADANWRRLATINFEHLWLPLRLRAYGVQPERAALPAEATEQFTAYVDGLTIHGFDLPRRLQSGQPFAATFYLSYDGEATQSTDYEISLRFLDGEGRLWQQLDQGLWPDYPPSSWPAGSILRYDHLVSLPAGTPPGDYQVWMRLIDRSQNRLAPLASGGVDLRLADVTVQAARCEQSHTASVNAVRVDALFGRSLLLKGHGLPAESYRPGHELSLDVLWCILKPPPADVRVQARLVDGQGQTIAEAAGPLTRPDHPASSWQAGELLQGQARLIIPAAAPAGRYDLRLSVLPVNGGAALPVNLGFFGREVTVAQVVVEQWSMETDLPEIERPLSASFGQPPLFELRGYELAVEALAPGESAPLTLYWRSIVDAPPVAYDVFVHLVQEGQPPQAQADGPPLFGFRPTSSWRAGEVFVDERMLSIPRDARPGKHRLVVGLYNRDTGERLPAFVDGERQRDDAMLLQPLTIRP